MTVEEMLARESIRQTLAAYTAAGDRLRVDEFIAVFTDDAILETEGVPAADSFRYAGKPAIRAWMERWLQPPKQEEKPHQSSFIRHHLSTCHIELTGADGARARTYWSAWTDIGTDHTGYYVDTFRKVGERWLIAHRKIRLDWRSENSLYFNAVQRTSEQR
jgi:3-phenylpropionate/cinnamic acid dioxygenase small subunit